MNVWILPFFFRILTLKIYLDSLDHYDTVSCKLSSLTQQSATISKILGIMKLPAAFVADLIVAGVIATGMAFWSLLDAFQVDFCGLNAEKSVFL